MSAQWVDGYSATMNDLRGVIRYFIVVLGFAFLAACGVPGSDTQETPSNRWADERLWTVLEAQELRDTEALCALLEHEAPEVREAAALAFASVQDTLGIPCLMGALGDTSANVRATAVFALGFVADSLTIERMAELAINERDSSVQRAYLSASFLAMQRNGMLKDPSAILYFLQSSRGQDRARAADVLRRLPPMTIRAFGPDLLEWTMGEYDPDVRALLILGLGSQDGEDHIGPLKEWAVHGTTPGIRINAVRALGRIVRNEKSIVPYALLADPDALVRAATLEQLAMHVDHVSSDSLLDMLPRLDRKDPLLRYGVLALLSRTEQGDRKATDLLLADRPPGGYAYAEWLRAVGNDGSALHDDSLRSIMLGTSHPAVRQAAFELLAQRTQRRMLMPRAISYDMQVVEAASFYRVVFESGDAGLICAAAEQLRMMMPKDLAVLIPARLEEKVMSSLLPVRDLEARILIAEIVAKRDGLPPLADHAPPFNNHIDPAKLRALPQGQRYRITTTKGEVIIATDVNETPGSSLAFDSLVTAGYYNGKAFHRMVPNFVVQGGCPRGDGYGGMPWTLRTEIGRKLFTAGSVGLASAGRDTESCQFFITHSATPHLDGRYTRFGEVVEGMDVVWQLQVGDAMERVERID